MPADPAPGPDAPPADLLAAARWSVCGTLPGVLSGPDDLRGHGGPWLEGTAPGTVAEVLRRAEGPVLAPLSLDAWDWWYRCDFTASGAGPWLLELHGLATVADVWLNGDPVLHSENMFVAHRLEVGALEADNELVLRFAALAPLLEMRRPRPRWKTQQADHQSLRWFRTSLIGRQPGYVEVPPPVGPYRGVTLRPAPPSTLLCRRVVARCHGDDGVVEVDLRLRWRGAVPSGATLTVGDAEGALDISGVGGPDGGELRVNGSLRLAGVERWWPHTHGPQPLYRATVDVGRIRVDLGAVGFRTVELDRSGDGFRFVVNGEPVFCRGACWWPVDVTAMSASDADLRATLTLARQAHMNMLRIPGGTLYEDGRFWDLCDELGIMVWQDCMLGYFDPPDDDGFVAGVVAELEQVLAALGGRPALALVCGGQEIEEQAAYFGLARQSMRFPLIEDEIPELVGRLLPEVPYTPSSPTGGALAFEADAGDCHYWGIGSLLRDLDDPRRCGIRFMSEGLGLGTPPGRQTVDEAFGGEAGAGHGSEWKRAVHHDTGRSWDLDDIRDFYAEKLFGLDPHLLRYLDPQRALDVGRATNADLMIRALSEWRRVGSDCWGALVVALRDLVPGPGWGLVDALGRPKSTWYALRRVLAPLAVLVTDEGINGLRFHVVNDGPAPLEATLRLEAYTPGATRPDEASVAVAVGPRARAAFGSSAVFGGFRDLGYAYRYGPTGYDAVVACLLDADGDVLCENVHLPMGNDRPLEPDVGLRAEASPIGGGAWALDVSCSRLAQWVDVDTPGFSPSDSWFHLVPGRPRRLVLTPVGTAERPRGHVRALNARAAAAVTVPPAPPV